MAWSLRISVEDVNYSGRAILVLENQVNFRNLYPAVTFNAMDKGRCSSRAQYLLIKGIAATSGIVSRLQDTAHRTPYYVLNPQALSPKPHKIYSRNPEAQTFKA